MASPKPAIVIVPGAWYERWHYRHLHNGLAEAGYEVTTVDLPSTGGAKPEPNITADLKTTASAISTHISHDRNVVVVMHSYGGLVGTCACEGLLQSTSKTGYGVTGLVYICAGAPIQGISMMDAFNNQHFPWARLIPFEDKTEPNTGIWMFCDNPPAEPENLFFHDLEPEERAEAVRRLKNWSEGCLWSKATYSAWKECESFFLICSEDRGMDPNMQEQIVEMLKGDVNGGKGWSKVERVGTGHSPFLCRPEETVGFVRRCCGEDV